VEEVKRSIKRLKNKKAAGLDRIRNEMLKSGAHYLTPSLTKLFTFILSKGTYPDSWSTGLISPIFKLGVNLILQIIEAFVSLVA